MFVFPFAPVAKDKIVHSVSDFSMTKYWEIDYTGKKKKTSKHPKRWAVDNDRQTHKQATVATSLPYDTPSTLHIHPGAEIVISRIDYFPGICITSTSCVCLPLYNVSLIVFLNCKSLWIKASAKWINVYVMSLAIFFIFYFLLFVYYFLTESRNILQQ